MAAQGRCPSTPVDLADLLQHLLSDSEPDIRETAGATLGAIPGGRDARGAGPGDAARRPRLGARPSARSRSCARPCCRTPPPPTRRSRRLAGEPARRRWPSSSSSTRCACCAARRCSWRSRATRPHNDQRRRLRELRETFQIGEKPASAARAGPASRPAAAAGARRRGPGPSREMTEEEAVRYLGDEERRRRGQGERRAADLQA